MPELRPSTVSSEAVTSAERDLRRARASLVDAELAQDTDQRYLEAQLAALRAAAVVLGLRGRPGGGSRSQGPRNAWRLLAEVAPGLGEWATFFDLTQTRTETIRAGHRATQREADDLVHDAQEFLALVERLLTHALRAGATRRPA